MARPGPWRTVVALAGVLLAGVPLAANPARADEGDVQAGRDLAKHQCARCHVIDNPFGGIGSTPSFNLLAGLDDYRERMETFFARRPHPAFVRVPGVDATDPGPAYARIFRITSRDIANLVAFSRHLRDRPAKQKGRSPK